MSAQVGGDLTAQFRKIIEDFEKQRFSEQIFNNLLTEAGRIGVDAAKSRTPVRTGTLRDGNTAELQGRATLHFHNDVEYGPFVNYGTSRQPPKMFFDAGIEAIKEHIEKTKL